MSVVGNVGKMNNPRTVFGGRSCGRSHMLNSIAGKIVADNGGPVLRTTGIRLALGGAREGAAFAKRFEAARALIVDDLDLLHVVDANKGALAKLFPSFLTGGRQLVFGSAIPPKSMGAWEVPLGFTFAQGWSVEMKAPGAAGFRTISTQLITAAQLGFSEPEAAALVEKTGGSLPVLVAWLRRLSTLRRLGNNDPAPSLLAMLDLAPEPCPIQEGSEGTFKWQDADGVPLGFFYPQDSEPAARFLLAKVRDAALHAKLPAQFREVAWKAYDPGKPSSFYDVCDFASRGGAGAALVLGAPADLPVGRTAEFEHALERALPALAVKPAFVPFAFADAPASAVRAAVDLSAAWPA
jgi:hypothetical protein